MSEISLTQRPTRTTRSERKSIKGRLKQVLDDTIWHGDDPYKRAQQLNLAASSVRYALNRADVQQYIREGCKERLNIIKARALHALEHVAMTNDQMPGVQACKALLDIQTDLRQTKQTTPGVIIQIVGQTDKPMNVVEHVPTPTDTDSA